MERRALLLVCLLALLAVAPAGKSAREADKWQELRGLSPPWLTDIVLARTEDAARQGLAYDAHAQRAVPLAPSLLFLRPGAFIVSPSQCTVGFVFGPEGGRLLSTAGHCVAVDDRILVLTTPLIQPQGAAVVASVGRVISSTASASAIGFDYALIEVDSQWQPYVDPNVANLGGPSPTPYSGSPSILAPLALKHTGWPTPSLCAPLGAPSTGIPIERVGVSTSMDASAFYFVGAGCPGDSGGPVLTTASRDAPLGQAIGLLTHRLLSRPDLNILAGTRISAIPHALAPGDLDPRPG